MWDVVRGRDAASIECVLKIVLVLLAFKICFSLACIEYHGQLYSR